MADDEIDVTFLQQWRGHMVGAFVRLKPTRADQLLRQKIICMGKQTSKTDAKHATDNDDEPKQHATAKSRRRQAASTGYVG